MTILDEIAQYAAYRIMMDKHTYSLEDLKLQCKSIVRREIAAEQAAAHASGADAAAEDDGLFRFGKALKKPGISVISEVKKASPSKGVISEDFPFLDIASEYVRGGADCISCLTEPKWFLGSDDIFAAIRAYAKIPMIRKDFVIDEYQIYQAKTLGADAVLLICALLDTEAIRTYLALCRELRMDALVETHDEEEIKSAVAAGAKIIGVNNRNLKDFTVDFENAKRLRELIPADCIYVAESGVTGPEDVEVLKEIGADAVLVGEALMKAENKRAMIRAFKGLPEETESEAAAYAASAGKKAQAGNAGFGGLFKKLFGK